MLHDEAEYPEPFKFMPERWILKDGQKEPLNPVKAAFGFGRRCVLNDILASYPNSPLVTAYAPARA